MTKKDDEYFEYRLDHSYKVGQSVGLEESAKRIWDLATEAFKSGKDEKAEDLRRLARELEKAAKERHPGPPK